MPDFDTPYKEPGWSVETVKYTAMKAVVYPILLPLWFAIASVSLTAVKFAAGRRQQSLKYESDWITTEGNQASAPATTKTLADEPNTKEAQSAHEEQLVDQPSFESLEEQNEERDADDNEMSIFQQANDRVRKQMIINLNQLNWVKVDVFIDVFNGHAAIVQRSPYKTGVHCCVLVYLANKFIV